MHAPSPVPSPARRAEPGLPRPASHAMPRAGWRGRVAPAAGIAAVAALALVLWLLGGFTQTPQEPAKRAGKPIDQGWFTVTVQDARIGTAAGTFGSGPQRFLIVRMHVVNKGKETAMLGGGGLSDGVAARAKNGKWLKPDQVTGQAAGAPTTRVQPGLPVDASAMWRMGPADAPKTFTVGLREWEFGAGFTDDEFRWRIDPEKDGLAGKLTLPVAAAAATPSRRSVRPSRPGLRTPATGVRPGTSARPGRTAAPPRPTRPATRPTRTAEAG